MASERLRAILDAVWAGGQATAQASAEIGKVGTATEKSGKSLKDWGVAIAAGTATLYALQRAAGQVWGVLSEGAQLELAASRFDRLTASIGSSADVMLGKLRAATSGMISDAELMASASEIISLGLMDTEDGVVRLARVVGELGLNMQQVIMTFANDSKMRLDALGLSVTDVEARTKKFEAAGHEFTKAFDLAVLEALEDRLTLLGSAADMTAGQMMKIEAALQNIKDAAKRDTAEAFAPLINFQVRSMEIAERINQLEAEGVIGAGEAARAHRDLWFMRTNSAEEYLNSLPGVIAAEEALAAAQQAATADMVMLQYQTRQATTGRKELAFETDNLAAAEKQYTTVQNNITRVLEQNELRMMGMASALEAEKAAAEAATLAQQEHEQALRELAIAYGGEFMTALQAGDGATQNFTATMLAAAAQGGANAETLALLAAATGEYSDEQIRAALETAAMTQKAQELGKAIADGSITVGEALLQFQDFRAELEEGVVPEVDASDVTAAIEEAEKLRIALEAASGNWTATFNIVQSGVVPSPATGLPGGGQPQPFAEGTDGWRTVPGPVGAPYPVTLHGGELFNVVPTGQTDVANATGIGDQSIIVNIYPAGPLAGTPQAIAAAVGREITKRG